MICGTESPGVGRDTGGREKTPIKIVYFNLGAD